MRILQSGYRYELKNFGNPATPGQVLRFVEKRRSGGELALVNDGTTNAELARVLIDRLDNLQSRFPSDEVEKAAEYFKAGLLLLQARTARRDAKAAERKLRKG